MAESHEEQTPKSLTEARSESVKGINIKPDEARKRLEDLGLSEDRWDEILGNAHYTTALVHIARGHDQRVLGDVYQELFPKGHGPRTKENPENLSKIIEEKTNLSKPNAIITPQESFKKLPKQGGKGNVPNRW